jgi:hypothetical protein
MLNDHNEFLKQTNHLMNHIPLNYHSPQSFVRMTRIDMIVLQPSRNISHVSEGLLLFESSVFLLDAVVIGF